VTTSLLLIALGILVVLIAWVVYVVYQYWSEKMRFALFKEAMIAAFRIPRLFGYEQGQCFVCQGMVSRDQKQAQVVRINAGKLTILSASDVSIAEIYLPIPPHDKIRLAHLGCVSGTLTRRMEGGKQLFTDIKDDLRYVAFHDFETEQYYWGFFPLDWRPGDGCSTLPFNITQPEVLVGYLLSKARRR
jgi:hypothetical protein